MTAVWLVLLAVGVVAAAGGSRRAVTGALRVADGLGVSTGLVGVSLVAVGTDLPEIANSISAAVTGHGDLNVGDSTGSALTQVTLVLAILIVATPNLVDRAADSDGDRLVIPVGTMTVAATLTIAVLVRDGSLSRSDGMILVASWAIGMIAVNRWQRRDHVIADVPRSNVGRDLARVLGWLAVVAAAAMLVVRSFVELTEALGVPELVASTLVLALGTSLPELVVDLTAIRRGAAALAIGDLFGSSLVDASLSIGIGPAVRATDVSAEAVVSVLLVALGIAAATIAWRVVPRRRTTLATAYFAIYVATMGAILTWAS